MESGALLKYKNVKELNNFLNSITDCKLKDTDSLKASLVDKEFLEEIKDLVQREITSVYFGKTLQDLKCKVRDSSNLREHNVYFTYLSPKRLMITEINLPHSQLQNHEFNTIEELVSSVQDHLDRLASFFNELELIDQNCAVMEPIHPTFKDDFRRIYLDERTWLHIEVTPDGLSTNVHLVGQLKCWQDKLNSGLLTWDHDMSIVENVMAVFDLTSFPAPKNNVHGVIAQELEHSQLMCGICLCNELPDKPGIPLPLCQNTNCGVHYHRDCLFEWLIASSGGRPPAFGVATGACPTCLLPITCAEKDG